ncbi:MAG: hypothetical protein Q8R28_15400 [Dehalococcoidia bacterium]|nr:hypothetical protein [Dehalococcoidia bacterium]
MFSLLERITGRARLRAERDAAIERFGNLMAFKQMTFETRQGMFEARFTEGDRGILSVIADAMYVLFMQQGGVNYVGWQMRAKDGKEPMLLTLQRKLGKTPHELRAEAEKELGELRKKLEDRVCPNCGADL